MPPSFSLQDEEGSDIHCRGIVVSNSILLPKKEEEKEEEKCLNL